MKTVAIPPLPRSLWAIARPAVTGTMPPWMPLEKYRPFCRCCDPPRPLQMPVSFPITSAMSSSTVPPVARKCPWPRWLENTESFAASDRPTATAENSWPMQVCTVPKSFPSAKSVRSFCSVRRMSRAVRNSGPKRSKASDAVMPAASGNRRCDAQRRRHRCPSEVPRQCRRHGQAAGRGNNTHARPPWPPAPWWQARCLAW